MFCDDYTGQQHYGDYECRFQLISGQNNWECEDIDNRCAVTTNTEIDEDILTFTGSKFLCRNEKQCMGYRYECTEGEDCLFQSNSI